MSSSAGLLALLSLLARAVWVTAQTENPFLTTTRGPTPQPTGFTPPPACTYPTNANQVGLVVLDGETDDGTAIEIGSCGCDVGKKAFYDGGPTADPFEGTYAKFLEFPAWKNDCADLCIIDEAGDECRFLNTSMYTRFFLEPYCARGKCHMYVYMQSGVETGLDGLTCGSRNFTPSDGWTDGESVKPMDPDTSPQAYLHAAAFTCKGCAAIRNSNCLKPVGGTTSTTTYATTVPGLDCGRIESLVQVDAANSSVLTTSLSAAWNGWSRPDKANFALYKKRIENTVYEPVWSGAEKVSAVSKIVDSYAPDGSSAKDLILAIPIAGWGTFCDFLNCAIRRGLLNGTEKDCWRLTPTTTAPLTTTTAPSESCAYPTNSSQVSLVVFDGEPRGGDSGEIGSCACDVGKKAFYVGGPTSDPYTGTYGTFVEYPLQKDGPIACADFCIIDEAGDECQFSNTSAQMTIYFQQYCTRGICHMYVYMGKSDDDTGSNGLICGSRNFTQRDGWNDDGTLKPMDPDTSPQAFAHAAAFTCKGCAATRNSNCLKPVAGTPGVPAPPNPTPTAPTSGTTTRQPGGMPGIPGVATPTPGGMPSVPGMATPTPGGMPGIHGMAAPACTEWHVCSRTIMSLWKRCKCV